MNPPRDPKSTAPRRITGPVQSRPVAVAFGLDDGGAAGAERIDSPVESCASARNLDRVSASDNRYGSAAWVGITRNTVDERVGVARAATPANEAELLEVGRHASVARLERLIRSSKTGHQFPRKLPGR